MTDSANLEVITPEPKDLKEPTNKEVLSTVKDQAKIDLVKRVSIDWPAIVEAQVDLAKGIWEERMVSDGKGGQKVAKVFKRAPSSDAGQYLINQVVGKPIETIEERKTVNLVFDS
jgi:hypothetical protein